MFFDKTKHLTHDDYHLRQGRDQLHADRARFELEKQLAKKDLLISESDDLKNARAKVAQLEADLKIEKARNLTIEAQKKAEYAEHVMKVADDRVAELGKIYDNYAKTLTDVVKAAHQPTINNVVK
jgi:hypothetical protein